MALAHSHERRPFYQAVRPTGAGSTPSQAASVVSFRRSLRSTCMSTPHPAWEARELFGLKCWQRSPMFISSCAESQEARSLLAAPHRCVRVTIQSPKFYNSSASAHNRNRFHFENGNNNCSKLAVCCFSLATPELSVARVICCRPVISRASSHPWTWRLSRSLDRLPD